MRQDSSILEYMIQRQDGKAQGTILSTRATRERNKALGRGPGIKDSSKLRFFICDSDGEVLDMGFPLKGELSYAAAQQHNLADQVKKALK